MLNIEATICLESKIIKLTNAFVSGAGGLRFKSRAGQIGRNVVNGSPPLLRFLKRAVLPGRSDAEKGP